METDLLVMSLQKKVEIIGNHIFFSRIHVSLDYVNVKTRILINNIYLDIIIKNVITLYGKTKKID